jgi:diguanylate cyclase (GGDEF)-like protein
MNRFHTLSIRHKLMLIIMVISTVSLMIASAALITTDRVNIREAVGSNLTTMTEVLAAHNTATILFSDSTAAKETLRFLERYGNIEAAGIFDINGDPVAVYRKPGFTRPLPDVQTQLDNVLFWDRHVDTARRVIHDGDTIGYVYIRSNLDEISDHLIWYLGIVAAVFAMSLMVSLMLGAQMQRIVSEPLLRLSELARKISTAKNYSLRASGTTGDELGQLVLDFNSMLDEIQARDDELEQHRLRLEERVAVRTRELEAANEELEAAKTQAESVAARMQYHAHHDSLTGLPNRILLNDRLNTAMSHARRKKGIMALLFLDLDRFKIINDSLGHAVGDQLLRVVARRLKSCVREEDTVARLGGDEFMVLLPSITGSSDAGKIGNKIINALVGPVSCHGHELHITTSVGVSLYPYDGTDADTLIKHADISMYRAKELGRNKLIYYTAEMNAESRRQLALETSLRRALERDEMTLVYQPKIDTSRNTIIGAEALLRWEHPTMGTISPTDFIPIAEDSGLIVQISEWALHTAFRQLKNWHRDGFRDLKMAVNLSSAQLSRTGLAEAVEAALADTQLDACMTELEITENVVMQNIDSAIITLEHLKAMGVSVSMDDFGTGYSSLSYLRRLPVDTVKIDKSFVRELPDNKEDASIAMAIIAMAKSLNLNVVAEGVENHRQLNFFRQQGVQVVQGYLFSKPVPAEAFGRMLKQQCAPGAIIQGS